MRKKDFTKNYIAEVFRDLLTQKAYNKISIVDICNTANISRMTFYNNFEDKIELTVWMVKKDVLNELSDNQVSFWDFYQNMVINIEKSKLFCLGMLNSTEHERLKSFYIKYTVSILERYTIDFFAGNQNNILNKDAVIELLAVLFIDAIENWILNYPDMPLEDFLQMCKIYSAITK